MCGIAGVVDWGDREALERMTAIQAHRGPDATGIAWIPTGAGRAVGLGSRRLAILDLSPAGDMPMWDESQRYCIVHNGEVYNYRALRAALEQKGRRFRSDTDTEVILTLYREEGPQCVRRLEGMFAFAIWDAERRQVLLARDGFGIKPLYYTTRGERFAFASEIKSFYELPEFQADLNLETLNQYLTLLWVPNPKTVLRNVAQVPPGHTAVFRDGRLQVEPYWDLEFPPADAPLPRSEAEHAGAVKELLRGAVRDQMRSDVPLGAFLSAGLDSTALVALMSTLSPQPVHTYTITFPKRYRVGENTLDNPEVARRTARRFGCRHEEIVLEPDVAALLPKLIWHMDEPVSDPALAAAYMVCQEARPSATVLLSGIGGDEVFAGYRKYVADRWARFYRKVPGPLRQRALEPLLLSIPHSRGSAWKGMVRLAQKMARSASRDPIEGYLANSTYMEPSLREALWSPALAAAAREWDPYREHRRCFQSVAHADFLNQMLYVDVKTFMVSLNLAYNDKMSMASSVEVRVPFLHRPLVEYVAQQVPVGLKLHGRLWPSTKHLLRRALADELPPEVLRQPKAGFFAPIDYWLANDLHEMTDDLLSPQRVAQRGLFNPATVARLVDEHRHGRRDWSMQIWQLLTLELWMEQFLDRPARPTGRPAARLQGACRVRS